MEGSTGPYAPQLHGGQQLYTIMHSAYFPCSTLAFPRSADQLLQSLVNAYHEKWIYARVGQSWTGCMIETIQLLTYAWMKGIGHLIKDKALAAMWWILRINLKKAIT